MTIRERLDELKPMIDKLAADRKLIETQWAKEVKAATESPKFNVYSKKADKIFRKIADKYTPMMVDIDFERDELVAEYNDLLKRLQKLQEDN